jgi:hypothetical protein
LIFIFCSAGRWMRIRCNLDLRDASHRYLLWLSLIWQNRLTKTFWAEILVKCWVRAWPILFQLSIKLPSNLMAKISV